MMVTQAKNTGESLSLRMPRETITLNEACKRFKFKRSYMYKLTSQRRIPHYKSPTGKMIFFDALELEAWLLSNRISTIDEIREEANARLKKLENGGKR